MDANELFVTAQMARLTLRAGEMEKLRIAVEQMLAHFSHMKELDVESLAPTTHPLIGQNRTRQDQEGLAMSPEELLRNAPERDGELVVIPNVL